ncbi:hypothetical protein BdWA1_002224 [Babesia duncani]|uniref:Uncharacterized protein n=1 Tax=Babesia duncani TaxID=323732 RepID=A0AAD9UPK4_9APIC|nr:hypothetical protein BdWA1_002224 [Babesia duncani]
MNLKWLLGLALIGSKYALGGDPNETSNDDGSSDSEVITNVAVNEALLKLEHHSSSFAAQENAVTKIIAELEKLSDGAKTLSRDEYSNALNKIMLGNTKVYRMRQDVDGQELVEDELQKLKEKLSNDEKKALKKHMANNKTTSVNEKDKIRIALSGKLDELRTTLIINVSMRDKPLEEQNSDEKELDELLKGMQQINGKIRTFTENIETGMTKLRGQIAGKKEMMIEEYIKVASETWIVKETLLSMKQSIYMLSILAKEVYRFMNKISEEDRKDIQDRIKIEIRGLALGKKELQDRLYSKMRELEGGLKAISIKDSSASLSLKMVEEVLNQMRYNELELKRSHQDHIKNYMNAVFESVSNIETIDETEYAETKNQLTYIATRLSLMSDFMESTADLQNTATAVAGKMQRYDEIEFRRLLVRFEKAVESGKKSHEQLLERFNELRKIVNEKAAPIIKAKEERKIQEAKAAQGSHKTNNLPELKDLDNVDKELLNACNNGFTAMSSSAILLAVATIGYSLF